MTMNIQSSNQSSNIVDDKDLYKRLVRKRATPNVIGSMIEPVMARISARINDAFSEASYGFRISFENHKMAYDFKAKDNKHLFLAIGPRGKSPLSAVAIDIAEAKKVVDLMLGADPSAEMEVDYEPMVSVQEAVFIEFGVIFADALRIIFNSEAMFDAKDTQPRRLETALEDLVELQTILRADDLELRFSLLVSQKALLKLQVRQSDETRMAGKTAASEMHENVQPERNVDLKVDAVVALPSMTLEDVAKLHIGQKIPLNETPANETLLMVNGRKMHRGRIGQDNSSYALLVEEAYEPMQSVVNSTQQ